MWRRKWTAVAKLSPSSASAALISDKPTQLEKTNWFWSLADMRKVLNLPQSRFGKLQISTNWKGTIFSILMWFITKNDFYRVLRCILKTMWLTLQILLIFPHHFLFYKANSQLQDENFCNPMIFLQTVSACLRVFSCLIPW